MAANFPSADPSFTTKSSGETIAPGHINSLQDEVVAIGGWARNNTTFARASAYHNASQAVVTATDTQLSLNSEDFDQGTMHDTATNNTRLTVPSGQGGVYWIAAGTTFAGNATGTREMYLLKNGTTKMAIVKQNNAGASASIIMQIGQLLVLAAGDYLEAGVTQDSGGNLDVGSATRAGSSFLQMIRIW